MVTKKKSSANFIYATGRRKSSIARVWLMPDQKDIVVNETKFETYFPRETLRMIIEQPFVASKLGDKFGVKVRVKGGGLSGQAGAVRLGISRALVQVDEGLRSTLRQGGLLTRDPRKKERKKYGRKGARRSFQFTKR